MALYDDWQLNAQYSFSTVAQGILPLRYNFVRFDLKCTFEAAKAIGGLALYAQWRQIYPHLTDKTIADDPSQYTWLMFTASDGSTIWMASPWIESGSVVPVVFRQERIILTNTSEQQISQVKNFLNAIQATYTSEPVSQ